MKVSVLIPAYNCQDTIYNCIRSIRKQTYTDIEIIIVNDGSTDETAQRLNNYAKYFKKQLKVIHSEHQGVAVARNTAISHATGDYIFFVDADDWIHENTIEEMINKAVGLDADVVICGNDLDYGIKFKNCVRREMIPNRRMVLKYLLKDTKVRNFAWGKLYRKSLWNNITFPNGKFFEDVATIHKVLIKSMKTVIIPNIFYHYESNNKNSITYSLRPNILPNMIESFSCQAENVLEFDPTLEKEVSRMMLRNKAIVIISLLRHKELKKETIKKIFPKTKYKVINGNSDLLNKTQ